MAFVWDTVTFINLVLCIIIVVLGLLIYREKGTFSAILISGAFGLFALSHIYTLSGMGSSLEFAMISARTCGYLLVIAALYLFLVNGRGNPED